jgi:ribosome-associated protein
MDIKIPFSELNFSFARSSGSGGQNVNKVNSKVTMYWDPEASEACPPQVLERFKKKYSQYVLENGQIQIISQLHRSQKANIEDCVKKLHEMLSDVATPPKARKPTKPKRSAVLKRLQTKKKDSEKKRLRKGSYE